MLKHARILAATLLVNGLTTVLAFYLLGYYYEEYQSLFHAFLSQAMSPGVTFNSWYYQGYIGISRCISLLYLSFPSVEWLSWISYGLLLVSSTVITYAFAIGIKHKIQNALLIISLVLVSFILLTDNILHLQNARVSYLLAGAGSYLLILRNNSITAIKAKPITFLAGSALFIIAALLRLEPAMGVVYLMFAFALLWHKSIRNALTGILVPALFTLSLFAWTMVDLKTSTEFHKQIEPDVEMQLTVRNNIVPIGTMKTQVDSVKYEAAKNMLWGDPRVITVLFLRSLIYTPPYSAITSHQIKRAFGICFEYFVDYWHFSVLLLLLSIAILYSFLFQDAITKAGAFRLLFFLLVFLTGVFLQTYYVKMRPWAFSPFFSLFFIGWALLFFKERNYTTRPSFFTLIFYLFAVLFLGVFMMHSSEREKEIYAYNQALRNTIRSVVKSETLLINPSSYQAFLSGQQPFEKFDFSAYHKLFFYESQIASILPGYRDYLMKECHCDVYDITQFYQYLMRPEYDQRVYALSTEKRMNLITRYVRIVHGIELPFEKTNVVLPPKQVGDSNPLFLYTLKKTQAI